MGTFDDWSHKFASSRHTSCWDFIAICALPAMSITPPSTFFHQFAFLAFGYHFWAGRFVTVHFIDHEHNFGMFAVACLDCQHAVGTRGIARVYGKVHRAFRVKGYFFPHMGRNVKFLETNVAGLQGMAAKRSKNRSCG
jgi:hypothetical protein